MDALQAHRVGEGAGPWSCESLQGPASHLFLPNNDWLNPLMTRYTVAIPEALDHPRFQSTISAAPKSFANSHKPRALIKMASTTPKAIVLGACASGISTHNPVSAYNLVDALTAKTESVSELRQRLSPKAFQPDVLVSLVLAAGTWSQRTPIPAGEHLQGTNPIGSKFTFTVPLPGVVDPIAKPQLPTIKNFDVDRRDSAMVLSHSKLVERTNVQKELLRMIHTSIIVREVELRNSAGLLSTNGGGKHG